MRRGGTLRVGGSVSAALPYTTVSGGSNARRSPSTPTAALAATRVHLPLSLGGGGSVGMVSCRLTSRCYAGVGVFSDAGDDEEAEEEESEEGVKAEADTTMDEWNGVEDDESEAADVEEWGAEDGEEGRAARIEAAKARMEEEDKDPAIVLPGPVCDAFSAIILELRAGGHGTLTGPDGSSGSAPAESSMDDGASIEKISSWSNPEPWSTFSGLTEWQVKACLGDVRRTLKVGAVVQLLNSELDGDPTLNPKMCFPGFKFCFHKWVNLCAATSRRTPRTPPPPAPSPSASWAPSEPPGRAVQVESS
jgi:hypothetical protein